jgi:hypothetical protein
MSPASPQPAKGQRWGNTRALLHRSAASTARRRVEYRTWAPEQRWAGVRLRPQPRRGGTKGLFSAPYHRGSVTFGPTVVGRLPALLPRPAASHGAAPGRGAAMSARSEVLLSEGSTGCRRLRRPAGGRGSPEGSAALAISHDGEVTCGRSSEIVSPRHGECEPPQPSPIALAHSPTRPDIAQPPRRPQIAHWGRLLFCACPTSTGGYNRVGSPRSSFGASRTRAALRRPSAWLVTLRREGCFSPAVGWKSNRWRVDWDNPARRGPTRHRLDFHPAGL